MRTPHLSELTNGLQLLLLADSVLVRARQVDVESRLELPQDVLPVLLRAVKLLAPHPVALSEGLEPFEVTPVRIALMVSHRPRAYTPPRARERPTRRHCVESLHSAR